jgi:hypothetical protein
VRRRKEDGRWGQGPCRGGIKPRVARSGAVEIFYETAREDWTIDYCGNRRDGFGFGAGNSGVFDIDYETARQDISRSVGSLYTALAPGRGAAPDAAEIVP